MTPVPRARSLTLGAWLAPVLLAAVPPLALAGPTDSSAPPAPRPAASAAGASASAAAPTVRIYRSVDASGRVVFGDRPVRGAQSVEAHDIPSSADAESLAASKRAQAHWQVRAQAFQERRRDRLEAEAEQAREERMLAAMAPPEPPEPAPYFIVGGGLRGEWPGAHPGHRKPHHFQTPGTTPYRGFGAPREVHRPSRAAPVRDGGGGLNFRAP